MAKVISLLLCLAVLASIAFVDADKKKQRPYPVAQKVIILQAGPSATYPWVGHCPPKGKCKKFFKVARPPFPSFLPPAPRLPYYAPAQYAPAPYTAPAYSQPAPVYSAAPEPVYSPAVPVFPSEPVYSQPAPVYSQPAPVYSQPAPVYSESAEDYSRAPVAVDVPVHESNHEPLIPAYSQSETVPDLSSNYAIQEVSPPEFSYGSGSSDIGSSESQSYGDVAVVAPTYAPEAPAVFDEPAVEPTYVPAQEPVYVPEEPTAYSSASSSGEIQQEISQSTYVEEIGQSATLETVQQIDSAQAEPELTAFFNDPIYHEDLDEAFNKDAYEEPLAPQPSEQGVYHQLPVETFQPTDENYGERIRPRGGRR